MLWINFILYLWMLVIKKQKQSKKRKRTEDTAFRSDWCGEFGDRCDFIAVAHTLREAAENEEVLNIQLCCFLPWSCEIQYICVIELTESRKKKRFSMIFFFFYQLLPRLSGKLGFLECTGSEANMKATIYTNYRKKKNPRWFGHHEPPGEHLLAWSSSWHF